MSRQNRRQFLQESAGSLALAATVSAAPAQNKEKLTVAVIGCGGMGTGHLTRLVRNKQVQVAYICDPDENRLGKASKIAPQAKPVGDMRRIFDDKVVDAVWIATPDHWHAPATILACQAGKHVYVEKPCCHNIREGRLMIEAARKHKRVVQVGTQSRSTAHVIKAIERLKAGAIGEILVAKAWNSQKRRNIGKGKPGKPPPHLDYDLWVGPASMVPFQANRLHYNWHWWYNFGTGDMGNDGVHDLDIARWGLGVDTHPTTITGIGGKYFFDDDQQFPDTQYVVFEYPGNGKVGQKKQLIYEHRIWSPYTQEGYENGNAFYGTNGMMILGKGGGWKLFGPRNKLLESAEGGVDVQAHHENFLTCIRSGNTPSADIAINHLSSTLCHLGNIACRLGRMIQFDPHKETIVGDAEAAALVGREYRKGHWAAL
ncbi:MAG: NADH-dependent dehydrogenase [Gemmatales bacterium]|nr:MAG: NADH-dependent dehydrogenase [Gemmatales bacterium]